LTEERRKELSQIRERSMLLDKAKEESAQLVDGEREVDTMLAEGPGPDQGFREKVELLTRRVKEAGAGERLRPRRY
jgi:hypothetical protein